MKKIYSIIFAAAALFAASSCQEEIVEPDLGTQENESMTITAGFGAETKTVLDGLKTYWKKGDQISVFDYDHDANSRCFSIDETVTTFEDGKAASAKFKYDGEFVWPQNNQPDPLIVALYPYQENAFCSFFIPDKNDITGFAIPTEQVALEGGFDDRATFALATSKYSERDNLTFTNLYSLLRITINEDGVKEVKVTVEGGKIAGEAKVQLKLEMEDENTPIFNGGTLSATENGTNTVTLTCEDGFVAGKDYYIAIAPVIYTNIKVYLDDVLVKDTTPAQPKALSPNTIYNIKDLQNPEDRGLSFPQDEYSVFLGNDFTAPKLSGETTGVTYSSSNTDVATVDENTGDVTIKAVGTTVITATAPQTTEYKAATVSYTLKVSAKEDRGLKFSETAVEYTFGEEFTAPKLSGATDGVTYSSSNEEVATVDGEGNVTIEGAGETTITASADANETHLAGSAEYTLTVNKAERTLTFSASTFTATVGDSFTPPTLTGTPDPSGVKYTSSNTGVATVDENTGAVELVGAGETTITASIEATAEYLADEVTYTITVNSPDVWGICGSFNSWTPGSATSLTYVGDGWYQATEVEIYKDDSFKFVKDESWDVNLGNNITASEGQQNSLSKGGGNIKVAKNGRFTVKLNPKNEVFTVECTEEYSKPKFDLYLKPNSNWKGSDARFAAYFFGDNTNTWCSMEPREDGTYGVDIPEGGYTTVIFCRMNPNTEENRWNNDKDTEATKPLWNQTNDLTIPTDTKNQYTVNEGAWSNGDGTWSVKQ